MDWNPLPHGEFEQLEDNLWCVSGSLPRMALPRRMTVIRLTDGRLVIHSAIALRADHMAAIEAWGTPAFIVVPGRYHRLDAPAYQARYPQAKVVCPAAATGAVAQVVPVHGTLDALPGGDCLEVVPLPGVGGAESALLVSHAGDRCTAVFNDVVFNLPHGTGLGGLLMRWMGSTGGPRVTKLGKTLMVKDPRALAQGLRAIAERPGLCRLVMSHGDIIEAGAPEVLRRVAADLT